MILEDEWGCKTATILKLLPHTGKTVDKRSTGKTKNQQRSATLNPRLQSRNSRNPQQLDASRPTYRQKQMQNISSYQQLIIIK